MNIRGRVAAALLLLATALAGCGGGADAGAQPAAKRGPAAGEKWNIVCTVGMVADVVRAVAGARGEVTNIIGEGVDPHLYTTTRSDVAKLREADIVFYSGLMLEGKMADALVRAARDGSPVYAVTELVDEKYLLEPEAFAGHYDPHLWMDVRGWMKAVEAVAAMMIEEDPDGAEVYRANAAAYLGELQRLDDYARSCIESIPERRRVLVTAHDAFNYFGRAYGIEVLGIQGISTEAKAGVNDINRLVDMIVDRGVNAVFVETSVAEKNVRALVQGAAARGQDVAIGGALFSDAMGRPGTYEGTYLGMIDHNVTTITRALGGDAPERGLNDKLSGVTHGTDTP
ncbi:MAG: metal ABC transporter solute-binding protein, Zn/Mn family [Planctomycetota bacterium]